MSGGSDGGARMEVVRTPGVREGQLVGRTCVTAAEQILRLGAHDPVAERWARGSAGVVSEVVVPDFASTPTLRVLPSIDHSYFASKWFPSTSNES